MDDRVFKDLTEYEKCLNEQGLRLDFNDIEFNEKSGAVISSIGSIVSTYAVTFPEDYISKIDLSDKYFIITEKDNINHIIEFVCNLSSEKPLSFQGKKAEVPFWQFVSARNTLGITDKNPEGKKASVTDLTGLTR